MRPQDGKAESVDGKLLHESQDVILTAAERVVGINSPLYILKSEMRSSMRQHREVESWKLDFEQGSWNVLMLCDPCRQLAYGIDIVEARNISTPAVFV